MLQLQPIHQAAQPNHLTNDQKAFFLERLFYGINILYRYIMQVIEIQTLIDITDTKVNRPKPNLLLEHDQHRNFTTLKQCAELRSIINYDTDPQQETKDLKNYDFGTKYKGKQRIWTFRFTTDREGVYQDDFSPVGCLVEDLHEVPVIQNLKETINIDKAIFDLKDPENKNTVIKALKGTI